MTEMAVVLMVHMDGLAGSYQQNGCGITSHFLHGLLSVAPSNPYNKSLLKCFDVGPITKTQGVLQNMYIQRRKVHHMLICAAEFASNVVSNNGFNDCVT